MSIKSRLIISLFLIFLTPVLKAGEKSVYEFTWLDPDKEVYVLQNRKYRKDGKVHLSVGYGMTTSGAFVDAYNLQGRIGYFLSEDFGFEYLYSKNSGEENNSARSVRNTEGVSGSIPFRRIVLNYHGAMILWSPFYGKVNTFNKVVYFDWIIGGGYGQLREKNNRDEVVSGVSGSSEDKEEAHSSYLWGTALKFYISERFHVKLDLTGVYYEAISPAAAVTQNKSQYYNNYDLTLALGLNF